MAKLCNIRGWWLALAVLLLGSGLLPAFAGPTPATLPVWPAGAADPYIVYVRDICGPKDIGAKAPFFSRLANSISGVSADSQNFSRPFGLSADEAGNLVVTDTGANEVSYLDFGRKKWQHWTAAGKHRFISPVAAVHHGQMFYVADSGAGAVIAFDEKGRLGFEFTNNLARPAGVAVLGDDLIIADSELHQVVKCDLHGKFIAKFGQRGQEAGEFNFPTHISVDARRQVYVTDSLNYRVQVFDAEGRFLRMFGTAGDGPGHFSRPKGAAADTAGHVYVVDGVFGNVQIFNEQGRLLLDFGSEGAGPGQFCLPNAIAINSRNEIFVADAYNHRIQMFRYTGKE